MRTAVFAYLFSLFSLLPLAEATVRQVEKHDVSVDNIRELSVHGIAGNIEITTTSETSISIEAEKIASSNEELPELGVAVKRDGEKLIITADAKRSDTSMTSWFKEKGHTNLRLTIPRGFLALRAETVSGNMRIQGEQASIELQSVSGDINLEMVDGTLRIENVSGDLHLRAGILQGGDDCTIHTVSGDIDLRIAGLKASAVGLTSVSGDITVNNHAYKQETTVISDASEDLSQGKREAISISSVSGDIMLSCPHCKTEEREETSPPLPIESRSYDDEREGEALSLTLRSGAAGLFPEKSNNKVGILSDVALGLRSGPNSQVVLHNQLFATSDNGKALAIGYETLAWGYRPYSRSYSEFGFGLAYAATDPAKLGIKDRVGPAIHIGLGYQVPVIGSLRVGLSLSYSYALLGGANMQYFATGLGISL